MKKIILASTSAARKRLLKQIGLKFTVEASNHQERMDLNLEPRRLAEKLSLEKAKIVAARYKNALVIAADTLIVFKGKLLGKPNTEEKAQEMLRLLSGRGHLVITGFTIIDTPSGRTVTKSVETKVYMRKLSKREVEAYVGSGEPLNKAGAYGIQEKGGMLIEKIIGDYFNVVGLPINAVAKDLKKFGVHLPV